GDVEVAVLAPHVLEQDGRAGLELSCTDAAEQNLLVERDGEVRLVAAVGDLLRSHADADARGACDAARRRLDLRGDDLGGPDAGAHLRRGRAERLAAALRAFARVADYLDDVLAEGRGMPRRRASFERQSVTHANSLKDARVRSRARRGATRNGARCT